MKLITLNTWGKDGPYQERWNYFLQELAASPPDVMCLQEVADDELTRLIQKFLRLSHHVSDYKAGLLIISKFPLSGSSTLVYQHVSPSEKNYERKALITKFAIGTHELLLANTHLAWREEDRPVRDGQISELLKTVKSKGLPSLICGDLNDIPESSPLELTRSAGYENLIQSFQPDTITWDNHNPFIQSHSVRFPDRQIDYILLQESVSQILKAKSCSVAFNRPNDKLIYPSDHYGISAEF